RPRAGDRDAGAIDAGESPTLDGEGLRRIEQAVEGDGERDGVDDANALQARRQRVARRHEQLERTARLRRDDANRVPRLGAILLTVVILVDRAADEIRAGGERPDRETADGISL